MDADRSTAELFLGLAIVAVEELLITPSQRHVIPLQGRPFEDGDNVSGLLTVQFLVVDGVEPASTVVAKTRDIRRHKSPDGQIKTSKSMIIQSLQSQGMSRYDRVYFTLLYP